MRFFPMDHTGRREMLQNTSTLWVYACLMQSLRNFEGIGTTEYIGSAKRRRPCRKIDARKRSLLLKAAINKAEVFIHILVRRFGVRRKAIPIKIIPDQNRTKTPTYLNKVCTLGCFRNKFFFLDVTQHRIT